MDLYCCLLDYTVHKLIGVYQLFWRKTFPCSLWYIALNFSRLLTWIWKQYVFTNCWYLPTIPYYVISRRPSVNVQSLKFYKIFGFMFFWAGTSWSMGNVQDTIARNESSLIQFCLSRYFLYPLLLWMWVAHSLHHSSQSVIELLVTTVSHHLLTPISMEINWNLTLG
jgi:hypothetical protein